MSGPFKMKGNPLLKDVKMYQGDGSQITVDDANLGEVYNDGDDNEARDYSYTNKDGKDSTDTLYLNKPRFDKAVPVAPPLDWWKQPGNPRA